jgi:hypothetical protein
MATVLEKYTTEEPRSVVRSFVGKWFKAEDIYKEMFAVYDGKCLLPKAVHNWVGNVSVVTKKLKRKWLRQRSEDFYAAGFDALVMWWDKSINVGGG